MTVTTLDQPVTNITTLTISAKHLLPYKCVLLLTLRYQLVPAGHPLDGIDSCHLLQCSRACRAVWAKGNISRSAVAG